VTDVVAARAKIVLRLDVAVAALVLLTGRDGGVLPISPPLPAFRLAKKVMPGLVRHKGHYPRAGP
jgi:hypothetical protein